VLYNYNLSDKENRSTLIWLSIIFCCIVWTCFEAPLSFALNIELKEHHLWWDLFFSLIFFIDIYLKIKNKLKLPNIPKLGSDGAILEQKPYHKSFWLWVDIITSIPYDIIASLFGLNIITNTIMTIRLLRIARIIKLRIAFEVIDFVPKAIKILFGLTAICLAIHWLACGWMIITPRPGLDTISYYNVSLYWAVTTLTTVGYGDITPATNFARIYTMFVMVIGVASYGVIIGNFSRMIMLADKYKEEKKEKLEALRSFMRYYNIPKGLQKQTFQFYNHVLTQNISKEEELIVKDLPQALQNELSIYKKIKLIKNVHVFKGCTTPCLKLIATKLTQTFHSPNEYIIKKGDVGDQMFIIGHGEFQVSSGDQILATLKDGQFFGEIALLEDTIRNCDIISNTYCDLYAFSKEDFLEVIAKYPELEEKFKEKYKRRQSDKKQNLKAA
jgi:voltage-gated potassium channel